MCVCVQVYYVEDGFACDSKNRHFMLSLLAVWKRLYVVFSVFLFFTFGYNRGAEE